MLPLVNYIIEQRTIVIITHVNVHICTSTVYRNRIPRREITRKIKIYLGGIRTS